MTPAPEGRLPDWEAFYRDYRKPGYVPGFEITTKLGGGMFGLVYRARRMSIGKDYAIKFLQVDDGEVQKAVLAELEAVKWFAQIDHPNLVSIEDRGEVDGIPYLVMAFAGTETLRDKITGEAPTGEAKEALLRWFLQSCRGLAALHERSLVHFDIKPANVFLKGSVARLGDYGLSKLVTHSRGSLSMGRGTPYYMAPEMLQRRGDHRSDVYSAGVLLYEILCGKVPFTGDSEWEVLKKHEMEPPAMPSHLSSREVAILQRCLQKDPAARFQSVHDLLSAFGAPATAGAAAWTDVRAGAETPPPPPSSGPAAPPPPGPAPAAEPGKPEEDPYTGFGRASREAMRHAHKIAQKAAREAGKIAQKAAEKARAMVRSSVESSRTRSLRRYFAMGRLRRQHRDSDAREQRLEVAEAIAAGPPPLPGSRRRRYGWIVAVSLSLVALLFLAVFFLRAMPTEIHYSTIASARSERDAAATESGGGTQTFHSFRVPMEWQDYVSTSEPRWVALASSNREAARVLLLAHIERLRAVAPIDEARLSLRRTLPQFEAPAAGTATRKARELVERIASEADCPEQVLLQLEQQGARGLRVAAEQLSRFDWRQADDLARAQRVHEWLVRTTRCRDLEILDEGDVFAERAIEANQKLGSMWLWFVNEFAHTPSTWRTYLELIGR